MRINANVSIFIQIQVHKIKELIFPQKQIYKVLQSFRLRNKLLIFNNTYYSTSKRLFNQKIWKKSLMSWIYITLYNFNAYSCFQTLVLTTIFPVKFLVNCASLANPCEPFEAFRNLAKPSLLTCELVLFFSGRALCHFLLYETIKPDSKNRPLLRLYFFSRPF